jgi:phosphopantetheinyl transferase
MGANAVQPKSQLWFVPPGPGPRLGSTDGEQRWGEALPPARRQQYWRSRAALRQLVAPLLGQQPRQLPLHSPPGLPPRLPPGLGWVSLSHAAGALLIAWSSHPVGVDLESDDRRLAARALMQRFYPDPEQRQLVDLEGEPLRTAVLRSWLVKEAVIKARHSSLARELPLWWLDHAGGSLHHVATDRVVRPLEGALPGWRWAAVGEAFRLQLPGPLTWHFEAG